METVVALLDVVTTLRIGILPTVIDLPFPAEGEAAEETQEGEVMEMVLAEMVTNPLLLKAIYRTGILWLP